MINRPENPCQVPEKFSSSTDQLLYEAILSAGGFVNDFIMIVPAAENKGFAFPPYDSTTKALIYELILALKNNVGPVVNGIVVDEVTSADDFAHAIPADNLVLAIVVKADYNHIAFKAGKAINTDDIIAEHELVLGEWFTYSTNVYFENSGSIYFGGITQMSHFSTNVSFKIIRKKLSA